MNKYARYPRLLAWVMTLGLSALVAGCGGGSDPILGIGGIVSVIPMVSATSPLATTPSVTGVAINSKITASFSKDMDSATIINPTTFTVACPTGTAASGTVTYLAASRVATFSPSPALPPGIVCTATISTGAKDMMGVALANAFVWQFTTSATADTTRPTVTFTVPADGDSDVATNTKVTAQFSEEMDPATITGTSFTLTGPGVTPVTGTVSYAVGTRTATFTSAAILASSTVFTATITTGSMDLASNALAVDKVWTFTTGTAQDAAAPTVILVNPADLATGGCLQKSVSATFSEAMQPSTINSATFTLQLAGPPAGTSLSGTVAYDVSGKVATFSPTSPLVAGTSYTATITTGTKDLAGNSLASNKVWGFVSGTGACAAPVNLKSLSTFAAVAGAGLTNSNSSGTTTLNGDVGLSPTATCLGDGSPCTSVNPVINGTLYANDPAGVAAQAKSDLTNAYTDATSRAPGTTVNDISGMVLLPGVYTSGSTMSIAVGGTVTLDAQGNADAVWIFQIGSSLTVNNSAQVLLINGAKANNVFWAVFASSTLGSDVSFQGNILAGASNSVGTDSVVVGRLLCTTGQITLLSNTVTVPAP